MRSVVTSTFTRAARLPHEGHKRLTHLFCGGAGVQAGGRASVIRALPRRGATRGRRRRRSDPGQTRRAAAVLPAQKVKHLGREIFLLRLTADSNFEKNFQLEMKPKLP